MKNISFAFGALLLATNVFASEFVSYEIARVVKVDPQYSVAYLSLGKAYKGCGLIELAASTWKEGISIAAK